MNMKNFMLLTLMIISGALLTSCSGGPIDFDYLDEINDLDSDVMLPQSVTCTFANINGGLNACHARAVNSNYLWGCETTSRDCVADASGKQGTELKWTSNCDGEHTVIIDGKDRTINFDCSNLNIESEIISHSYRLIVQKYYELNQNQQQNQQHYQLNLNTDFDIKSKNEFYTHTWCGWNNELNNYNSLSDFNQISSEYTGSVYSNSAHMTSSFDVSEIFCWSRGHMQVENIVSRLEDTFNTENIFANKPNVTVQYDEESVNVYVYAYSEQGICNLYINFHSFVNHTNNQDEQIIYEDCPSSVQFNVTLNDVESFSDFNLFLLLTHPSSSRRGLFETGTHGRFSIDDSTPAPSQNNVLILNAVDSGLDDEEIEQKFKSLRLEK